MKYLYVVLLTILSVTLIAQNQKYHRAKIYYNSPKDLLLLANQGVAIDHVKLKKGVFIESDFSDNELKIVKGLGLKYDIVIKDVQEYYKNQNATTKSGNKNQSCLGANQLSPAVPSHYNGGSMGGFLTYNEMLQELAEMQSLYPNLITVKAPISGFLTEENRPVYWVRMSDNPNTDEPEPEILYTALHHAREPGSLQQVIFYMWYLLENYNTNDEVKALLDNTEMYFVPCVNPDGYIYNETTNPSGGGMWRKNRKDNGDGTYGVDLNRNYGHQWGGAGTSTNTNSDVYLGTAPFSEEETQAMKWFCEQHNFKIALNSHTYSQLLLFPFGYASNQPTPDNALYEAISGVMVEQNGYTNEISSTLYPAAGDSDDWMYGETSTHNKILAMTPEVGSSFWPAQSTITDMCKGMVYHNLMAANFITNYAQTKGTDDFGVNTHTGYFHYTIQRLGLDNPGNFTVSIQPVSSNIQSVGSPNVHNGMSILQTDNDSISFVLSSSVSEGDIIEYVLVTDNGLYETKDTIRKVYGDYIPRIQDDAQTIAHWNTFDWGLTDEDSYSPNYSFTDSPYGDYTNQEDKEIRLKDTISLENCLSAKASFYARWDIETDYDYVQFEVSLDNGATWQAQCGKYTNAGTIDQISGQPLYDGLQNAWVKEEINLSDYLGYKVLFRFRLVSDQAVVADGFYFDDFKVEVITDGTDAIDELSSITVSKIFPNPASNQATLYYSFNSKNQGDFYLYNELGEVMIHKKVNGSKGQLQLDFNSLSSGVYYYRLSAGTHCSVMQKVVVVK